MERNSPCQIILAEDNPADVYLVREAFREHSFQCDLHVIPDGEEALTFISRLDSDTTLPCPDLLLLDLHLPKRDGEAVLKRLRASNRCGQTPVVILTSSDSPRDQLSAEQNAVVHYFRKPSNLGDFLNLGGIVKDIIENRASERPDES